MNLKRLLRAFAVFSSLLAAIGVEAQTASFTAFNTTGCAPALAVQFNNTSTGLVSGCSFRWLFGDGAQSTAISPGHLYTTPGVYSVTLEIICGGVVVSSTTQTNLVTLRNIPQVDMTTTPSPANICAPFQVCFNNTSTPGSCNIAQTLWDFGDGTTFVSTNVATPVCHSYTAAGNYSVTMVVTDVCGCTATRTFANAVTVRPQPTASFIATSPTLACTPPFQASFSAAGSTPSTPGGALQYLWDFNYPSTFTPGSSTANFTYNTQGSFSVALVVVDAFGSGCSDTLIVNNLVRIENLNAAFTASTTNTCLFNEVSFNNTSTGSILNYFWDFGNGQTSVDTFPTIIYPQTGCYPVSLVVSNALCADTFTVNCINVNAQPIASFTSGVNVACSVPITANYTSTSVPGPSGAAITNWQWNFAGGAPQFINGTPTPTTVYNAAGTFNTTLVITDANGCRDTFRLTPAVNINVADIIPFSSERMGCLPLQATFGVNLVNAPGIASCSWNFGDGSPVVNNCNPTHTFTTCGQFSSVVTVTTTNGCVITDTIQVMASDPPVANFTASPRDTCLNVPIQFTDLSTPPACSGVIDQWTWDTGEGVQTTQNPLYTYTSRVDSIPVSLIVCSLGCCDTLLRPNYITISPPRARFTVTQSCTNPYTVQFNDQSQGADGWLWNFGVPGAPTSTQQNPTFTFPSRGNFTVRLTASNSQSSCTDVFELIVRIREPIANFTVSNTQGCNPLVVSIVNSSQDAALYSWSNVNPNGVFSATNVAQPTITYNVVGATTDIIRLIIRDVNGCRDTMTLTPSLYASSIDATVSASPTAGCAPLSVSFNSSVVTDPNSTVTGYSWLFYTTVPAFQSFGTSNVPNPTALYPQSVPSRARLIVTNSEGCRDTVIQNINITRPIPEFAPAVPLICRNSPVTFTNTSTGALDPADPDTRFFWNFDDPSSGNDIFVSSTPVSPTYAFIGTGPHNVCLTVTDQNGCDSTVCQTVFVSEVRAGFTVDTTFTSCPPLLVNFTNTSTGGAVSCFYQFGSGGTSTNCNPSHIYLFPGVYSPVQIVTDAAGCTDTLVLSNLITIGGPVGSFSYNPTTGCVPVDVTFTINTQDVNSAILDTRDGLEFITPSNPISDVTVLTHRYDNPGYVVPVMLLEDSQGCAVLYTGSDTIKVERLETSINQGDRRCDLGTVVHFPTIESSVPYTLNWSFQGGSPSSSTSDTVSVNYTSFGVWNVTLIAQTNFCRDTVTTRDTIASTPNAIANYVLPNPCQPFIVGFQNNTLNGFGAITNWTWNFGDGSAGSSVGAPFHTYPVTPQGGLNTYTATLNAATEWGCSSTDTIQVVIYPELVPNAGPDTVICGGTSAQLFAGGGVTYQWIPATGLSCTTCPNPVASPSVTTLYTVIVSDAIGCQKIDSATVSVNAIFADAGLNASICGNTPYQLNGSVTGVGTVTWTPNDGSISNPNILNPIVSPATTTLYTLTVVDTLGCTGTDDVLIRVNPLPQLSITPDTTICQRNLTQVVVTVVSPSAPFVYSWGLGSAGLSCYDCSNPFATPNASTNYTVTVTDDAGCSASTATNVFVTQIPYVPVQDDTICPGGFTQLVSQNAISYYWTPVTGLSDPNISAPIASPATTTMYIVALTYANGCQTLDTAYVVVRDLSAISAGPDLAICLGDTIQLQGIGTGGTIGWSPLDSLSDDTIFNPFAWPTSTTTYTLTVDTVGCTVTDQMVLTVYVEAPLVVTGGAICIGDTLQLLASGAETYTWTPDNALSATDIPNPLAYPVVTTTYFVTGTLGTCLPDTDTVTVTVRPLPDIRISAPRRTFLPGETIPLTITGVGVSSYFYNWTPTVGLSCTDCFNPIAQPDGTTLYTVVATNEFGCTSSDSILLRQLPSCEPLVVVPSAFSPNGDGLNDRLLVRGIADLTIFRVFDRWGNTVFETNRIDSGWDGTYNGRDAASGVYVWYVEAPCPIGGTVLKKGNVTLVR